MRLKPIHFAIIVLVLFTAALHLAAAFDPVLFTHRPDPIFTLNALGYLGLLGAYFLPIPFFQENHGSVWLALCVYIGITIVAWVIITAIMADLLHGYPLFGHDAIYGVPAKLAEIALLVLLRRDRPS